jgi:5-formyltetrahydrofolate cyclo-ligase
VAAESVATAKRELRRGLLARRRAIPPETLAGLSAAVVARLRALPELAPQGPDGPSPLLLLYAAQADEPDVGPLLTDPPLGWRVALPRVAEQTLAVVPVTPSVAGTLMTGAFGIMEPAGPSVPATEVTVAIVPGVGFDAALRRLGRGGGYYDRLLVDLAPSAVTIGVCAEQLVHAAEPGLPVAPHDRTVDLLVTDASVRRRAGSEDAPATVDAP